MHARSVLFAVLHVILCLCPVSQRVAIKIIRTMDINRSSMANRIKLAINRNSQPFLKRFPGSMPYKCQPLIGVDLFSRLGGGDARGGGVLAV